MIKRSRVLAAVIVVLGIISAIIAVTITSKLLKPPRVPTAELTVVSDLISLGTQIEVFRKNYQRYPTSAEGLDVLVHRPTDPTIAKKWWQQMLFIDPDPWHRPFQYRCPGLRNSQSFDLFSLGPDGIESGDDVYFNERWQEEQVLDKAREKWLKGK